MTDTNREWLLAERPTGEPDQDSFELRETEVPDPDPGELLVRVRYLSVDPYMRGRMRDAESYAEPWDVGDALKGGVVGEVVETESDAYDAGDLVTGEGRWADYATLDADDVAPVDPTVADPEAYLGALGMPGRTAYFGLLDVGEPKPGDTVVVSGAAGAVGSVVGQIAKLNGCRVVGFAGSDEKTDWLTDDLGFDAAINYKATDDYRAALDEAAPDGVDVYFDNVGGPITDAVFTKLNLDARVAVCGQIAHYNDKTVPTGPRKLPQLISVRAKVQGLLVGDFATRFGEASERLGRWVASGDLEHRETVVEGLENAPDAFLGLFSGDNIGKQVVRVSAAEQ
ncbi:NADP-dependent oxidoreductase [Halorubrum sp. Atlit-8R]|uniref:NADP-dependent oxidoreductase n=1 Tax=unclassified Halorubrum TaxID=2642239 RepID=UPI000EF1AE9F|nr:MULTISPECIES: NADP-dependent oxidoreductase [unclassified Halorubrum]RLM71073.1 NADP-dependent oxidoreductase [Halorubrum sp. Atlit-9R]RLM71941.1 NADP-dependent oxidoreductase [Halorubrum sp. Atlit-9R]RLM82774.1 NADP-dependent oxidoreductase [Halorubrum sp. Atlit-8R]